jgi:hypothetical protein
MRMPIPGFSLDPPPETITAAEAVETVMERFGSSGCTEAEANAWASEQVREGKLKLLWGEKNPEYPYGQPNGLFLAGDNSFDGANGSPIYLPGLPGARALDELDWRAGELRRRVRWPKIVDREGKDVDAAALSDQERQRAFSDILWSEQELDPPADETSPLVVTEKAERLREYFVKEWVVEEMTYPFTVKRASLAAILDTVRAPLVEAADVIADRLKVSSERGLEVIAEAAAIKWIKVYGKPQYPGQRDRIRAAVWRRVLRREVMLSASPGLLSSNPRRLYQNGPEVGGGVLWSDLYVFRVDLERLLRELTSDNAGETETVPPKRPVNATADQSEKAKLRRRIKKALEAAARQDPPRAQTKAGWLELMRQEFGTDVVTDNLFDEAWQQADLPAAWRTPGRRT